MVKKTNRIPLDELEKYLWHSAVLLRTKIDAGAYKQYIFPLLFFKRLSDVYDEETQKALEETDGDAELANLPEYHNFMIPEGYHWNDVRTKSENIGKALVEAFKAIENANSEKLEGIFGDAAWTNKNRLPDRLLKDLIEHFSSKTLTLENCPEDELGQGYEYLIKQFADDSGHTAQEFYTNRTVVHLMTEILKPQSGESIYDPTCGSAGMLISSIAYLQQNKKEWRNVSLYGQEINSLTAGIGRMNLFLHGVNDFEIINGDTLRNPGFLENNELKKFSICLANPPYSISQWDREAFFNDRYGRNQFGVPPQARADYAFIQHILMSLNNENGRAAILLPHGVLNRNEEAEIRKAILKTDCIEAVIGLGRHLFYNSGLESCILVLNKNKPKNRKNKVQFIEAEKYTHKEGSQSYLYDEDIKIISDAYINENNIPGLSKYISNDEIFENNGNLNIKLYVKELSENISSDFLMDLEQYLKNDIIYLDNIHKNTFNNINVNYDYKFNKNTWKKVKLSDVADEYSERIDNPSKSDYEWYIGSDCIDAYSFTIARKTPISKVKSSQKVFKKGDYLLVRRSLYGSDFRERAPRADFDGVCSADILTIREKPGLITNGYLIAVLYSRDLWDFIVSNSTGSLTRRIKWSQLKDFEFLLPPLPEQKKLTEILWSIVATIESYKKLLTKTDEMVKSKFDELLLNNERIIRIRDLVELPIKRISKDTNYNEIQYIDISSIDKDLRVIQGTTNYQIKNAPSRAQQIVKKNDILISTVRPNLKTFATINIEADNLIASTGFCVLRAQNCPLYYLYGIINSDIFTNQMISEATGISYPAVNDGNILNFKIPDISEEQQKNLADLVEKSEKSKASIKASLDSFTKVYKKIIAENLGGK